MAVNGPAAAAAAAEADASAFKLISSAAAGLWQTAEHKHAGAKSARGTRARHASQHTDLNSRSPHERRTNEQEWSGNENSIGRHSGKRVERNNEKKYRNFD